MGDVLFYLLLGSAFLASAKAHGRHLRLERELEGHWKIAFGAKNHFWVEKLWARERIFFWGFTLMAAILLTLASWSLRRNGVPVPLTLSETGGSWTRFMGLLILGSMTFGFIVTGLMSFYRILIKIKRVQPPSRKWLKDADWGSALWWLLTFSLVYLFIRQEGGGR